MTRTIAEIATEWPDDRELLRLAALLIREVARHSKRGRAIIKDNVTLQVIEYRAKRRDSAA